MDNFAEQLVKREPTASDNVKKSAVFIGGGIAALLLVVLSVMQLGSMLSMLGFVLAVGIGYGIYFYMQSSYVEFVYTLPNSSLDFDMIIA